MKMGTRGPQNQGSPFLHDATYAEEDPSDKKARLAVPQSVFEVELMVLKRSIGVYLIVFIAKNGVRPLFALFCVPFLRAVKNGYPEISNW